MCSQDIIIQADNIRLAEDEVEILERLGKPETFHFILFLGVLDSHVVDHGMPELGLCVLLDILKHPPCGTLLALFQ